MTLQVKPGARLCSATCATEVVVVKGAGPVDVRCGGAPMVVSGAPRDGGDPISPHDDGTLIGKRYADGDDTVELLCTKPGAGSLSLGDVALGEKSAKPLPASD